MPGTNSKYDGLSDEELLALRKQGDDGITDYLMNKYKNLVRSRAGSMYILGADEDDLLQEGMIGLYKAIRDYSPEKDAGFITFATLCVSRQMYTAIESADRQKHMMLNSYVSIYEEDFQKEGGANPEEEFLDKERVEQIEALFEKELSPFERQVLDLHLTGMDYHEISMVLEKSDKSVDNALQRIKTKLKRVLKDSSK
ncbi:MAG: sigma-70 family RNA polymerase sigma factor [Lachnospiraceae bacterium]|nr:sigma-70 family RNA polymerase sigma factor [Lachnospiraceae bacterium]